MALLGSAPALSSARSALNESYLAQFRIKSKRLNLWLAGWIEISGQSTWLEAIDGIDGKIER